MENESFDPLDKSVQKRAIKAFKKRLKITKLNQVGIEGPLVEVKFLVLLP
jgi:hypothetical protein